MFTMKLRGLKISRLIKKLEQKFGCILVGSKGSHMKYKCDNEVVIVPYHAGKTISPGVLKEIVKKLNQVTGLSTREILRILWDP